ncbi:MAG: S-layer homology domain-containing protein, partial [Moorella sp. (in: Bacteria)]|nr:S-layer homology domain-containing protein [Moorella sp. (in: firmicutes)]
MNTLKTSYRALIALLLVSGILVAATPVLAATGFQDVTDGHWAARYISRMSALEVIRGYSDGTFRPDQAVTELEALIMAARCKSSTATITAPLPFAVPAWAEQDIARALALGLLKNDDAFFPEAAATRAWVTRLLVRLIGKEGEALGVQDPPAFTDSYLIPSWAAGYVKVARD